MSIEKKAKKISSANIYRTVASSSAIETGHPVAVIEYRLKSKNHKFSYLKLAQ